MLEEYLQLEKEYNLLMEKQAVLYEKIKEKLLVAVKNHAELLNIKEYPKQIGQIDFFQINIEGQTISIRWFDEHNAQKVWDYYWFEIPLEKVM